jgi:NADH-quinone oxidoreductase subunit L
MSQTLNASTLLAVPMAPLVGAVLAGILGTQFGGNWIGRRLTHTLTILGVLIAFILSASTLKSVAIDGARFNETLYTWMTVGGLTMEVGFMVDGLTAMMMCVVTLCRSWFTSTPLATWMKTKATTVSLPTSLCSLSPC